MSAQVFSTIMSLPVTVVIANPIFMGIAFVFRPGEKTSPGLSLPGLICSRTNKPFLISI